MRAKCIKFKRIKPKQLKSNLISIGCCNSKKKNLQNNFIIVKIKDLEMFSKLMSKVFLEI